VENVGFDSGKDFIDSKYPGADTTTSSHPDGGTWDAFVFGAPAAGVALRRGLSLKNVIGLMYNSQAIGHAVLTEGYTGGRLDNVTGIYGSHGVVIKGCDCYASAIYTYGQKENGLIVKADQFSDCGNVEVVGHYHARKPKGTSPWADPTYTTNAVSIDPNAVSFNGPIAISSTASAPVNHVNAQGLQPLAGVILNKIVTDGLAENGTVVTEYPLIIPGSNKVFRFTVGTLQVTNCNHVVYMAQPENNPSNQLYINRLECANITNAVVYSLDNSVITIGSLDADVIGSLYFMTGLGKIYVGNEKYSRMTGQKFISTGGGVSPSLSTGWSQSADNEIFEVCLKNNRVSVKGFLQAGTGATESIVTLPYPLRPASNPRIPAVYMISGNTSVSHVSVVDTIRTLDGTLPSGTQYVSLSGVEWDY
jgi:hypothetical protein